MTCPTPYQRFLQRVEELRALPAEQLAARLDQSEPLRLPLAPPSAR